MKKIRKMFVVALFSITCIATCLGFSACKNFHTHTYVATVSAEYLKTVATCTERAVYYKSCECGDVSNETFTYGDTASHNHTMLKHNHIKHWYECACGDKIEGFQHIPSAEATETTAQVCTTCGYVINPELGHVHNLHLTKVEANPAKCTEPGNIEYYTCSCGKWFENENATTEITDKTRVVLSALEHKFNQQKIDEKYFKSAATCVEKAMYYYSCICGETGTTAFEYGETLEHSFTNYVSNNDAVCEKDGTETAMCDNGCCTTDTRTDNNSALGHDYGNFVSNNDGTHTKTCSHDSTHKITVNCSGGTASCTQKAICVDCGVGYGSFKNHVATAEWLFNETHHYHKCATDKCTETLDKATHSFNSAKSCTVCGYVTTALLGTEIESSVYDINGTNLFVTVSNAQTAFTFGDTFTVADGATYKILQQGTVINGTVSLNVGENVFTLTVYNDGYLPQDYSVIVYRKNLFSVTFNTDGGNEIASQYIEEGGAINIPQNPTKTGHTFLSWSCDLTQKVTSDIVVNAIYKINKYTITLIYDNGQEDKVITKNYGEEIGLIANPTKEGYAFLGWGDDIPATMPAKDRIFKAVWSDIYLFDNGWFSGLKYVDANMKVLHIPSKIGGIEVSGIAAISGFQGETVIIPETVTDITNAFANSDVEIVFPSNCKITTLSSLAFHNYKGKRLEIPSSVCEIGENAFLNCAAEIIFNGTNIKEIKCFDGYQGTGLSIPNGVETISVLFGCDKLEKLIIPNTVKKMPVNLLYDCQRLKELTIPYVEITGAGKDYDLFESLFGVDHINHASRAPATLKKLTINGASTFDLASIAYCHNLEVLSFEDDVTDVIYDKNTLNDGVLSNITNVFIGNNIKKLNVEVFRTMRSLKTIQVDKENSHYSSDTGVLYTANKETMLCCPKLIEKEIHIDKNVKTIDTSIVSDVQIFGFTVDENNTEFKSINGVLFSKDGKTLIKYPEAKLDEKYVIPNGVTEVACKISKTNIAVLVVSDSVIRLGEKVIAFTEEYYEICNNANLRAVYLGESIDLPINVSKNNPKLSLVALSSTSKVYKGSNLSYLSEVKDFNIQDNFIFATSDSGKVTLVSYLGDDERVVLPDYYDGESYSVASYAFKSCKNLQSITLSGGVLSVNALSFFGCENLRDIKVPTQNTAYKDIDGVLYTKNGTNLIKYPQKRINKNYTVANGTKYIDKYAFNGVSGIDCIILPDGFEQIFDTDLLKNELQVTSKKDGLLYLSAGENLYAVLVGVENNNIVDAKIQNGCISIAPYAFSALRSLKSVNIPDTVIYIGEYAFYGCSNLQEVIISQNLTEITESVFGLCCSLERISIPDSVKRIGSLSFYSCYKLKIVTFGVNSKLEGIESLAFYNCSSLITLEMPRSAFNLFYCYSDAFKGCTRFVNTSKAELHAKKVERLINDNGYIYYEYGSDVTLVDYVGADTVLTIPNVITDIAPYTFKDKQNIKKIICPDSIKYFQSYAFYNCENLEYINMPTTLKSVGNYAFAGCRNLKEIYFFDQLTSIGSSAFAGCSALRKVTLGKSVNIIQSDAFNSCCVRTIINNSKLKLSIGSKEYGRIAQHAYYIGEANNEINYEQIGDYLFGELNGVNYLIEYLGNDENIILPSNYHGQDYVLDRYVLFKIDNQKKSITIPATGVKLGEDGIHMPYIEKIYYLGTIDGWVEGGWCALDKEYGVRQKGYDLYINGELLTSLEINESLLLNSLIRFNNCETITKLIIDSDVNSQINKNFVDEKNFEIYYLGTVDEWAKKGLLKDIDFTYNLYVDGKLLTEARINADTISSHAFANCKSVTSIVVLDGVSKIGYNAFNCENLQYLELSFWGREKNKHEDDFFANIFGAKYPNDLSEIPSALKTIKITNVQNIPESAFYRCESLETIILPNSIIEIGASAFNGCTAEIVWGDAPLIEVLGYRSFVGYRGSQIVIPSKVKTIDGFAFAGINTDIVWNGNVERIGRYAFSGYCGDEVIIPKGVRTIEEGTFNDCSAKKITLPNTVDCIMENAFNGCTAQIIFEAGSSLINLGSKAFYKYAGGEIILPNSVKTIGDYAFSESVLEEITLPENLTSVGFGAFLDCVALKKVLFNDNLESIGEEAFHGCSALTEIKITKKVKGIGRRAFDGCFADIVWDNTSISELGGSVFYGYQGAEIRIPASITKIGSFCFSQTSAKIYWDENSKYFDLKPSIYYEYLGNVITIPPNANNITGYAVLELSRDAKLDFSQNKNYKSIDEALYSIDGKTLIKCYAKDISHFVIPNGVEIISDGAFEECSNLEKITIASTVKEILPYAFAGIKAQIIWTEDVSIETVGESAFAGYQGTKLIIPNTVEVIGAYAFAGCNNLRNLTLGTKIKSIGYNAFSHCALSVLKYDGTRAEWLKNGMTIYEYNLAETFSIISFTDVDVLIR